MRNVPVNWLTWPAFVRRIEQMEKMVAQLLFATILECLPNSAPHPPTSFPIQRSSSKFYKFAVFACGGATVIPYMLKGFLKQHGFGK